MKISLSAMCLSLFLFSVPVLAGDLVLEVKGVRSDQGDILGAVHVRTPGVKFPARDGEGTVHSFRTRAREGTITVVFQDVAPGEYALTAFHDEDGSGEINSNALGIPTEGYAFGNDATGFMGPPKFEDVAVTLEEGAQSVTASGSLMY